MHIEAALELYPSSSWDPRFHARDLVVKLYGMGVHPDFLVDEPELIELFGEDGLRRLAHEAGRGPR